LSKTVWVRLRCLVIGTLGILIITTILREHSLMNQRIYTLGNYNHRSYGAETVHALTIKVDHSKGGKHGVGKFLL
jgi:hypothetical protein